MPTSNLDLTEIRKRADAYRTWNDSDLNNVYKPACVGAIKDRVALLAEIERLRARLNPDCTCVDHFPPCPLAPSPVETTGLNDCTGLVGDRCGNASCRTCFPPLTEADEVQIGRSQAELAVLKKDGRSYEVRRIAGQALEVITRLKAARSPEEPSRDIPTVPCGCIQGCINCAYTGRKPARPAKEQTAPPLHADMSREEVDHAMRQVKASAPQFNAGQRVRFAEEHLNQAEWIVTRVHGGWVYLHLAEDRCYTHFARPTDLRAVKASGECQHDRFKPYPTLTWLGSTPDITKTSHRYCCNVCRGLFDLEPGIPQQQVSGSARPEDQAAATPENGDG
jgi:uncharacterized small protein (DUF1192 family)